VALLSADYVVGRGHSAMDGRRIYQGSYPLCRDMQKIMSVHRAEAYLSIDRYAGDESAGPDLPRQLEPRRRPDTRHDGATARWCPQLTDR
jgi:hypothetical protein